MASPADRVMPAGREPAELVATIVATDEPERSDPATAAADVEFGSPASSSMSLGEVFAAGGASSALMLFAVNAVDELDRAAVAVLGPDIQRTFGLSDTALGIVTSIGSIATLLCAIPLAALGDRFRRSAVIGGASLVWALGALLSGFVQNTWQLAVARFAGGAGKGTEGVQRSLLADAYPIAGRGRVFGIHQLANPVGATAGPLLAGGIAVLAGGGTAGWRWALAALAAPALIVAIGSLRLAEPRRGRQEQAAVLGSAETSGHRPDPGTSGHRSDPGTSGHRSHPGTTAPSVVDPPIPLSVAWERLKRIPTYFHALIAFGVVGLALFGVPAVQNLFVEERYGLDSLGRGVVTAGITVGGAAGVLLGGTRADRLLRDPPRLLRLIGVALAAYGAALPLSLLMPNPVLYTVVNAVGLFSLSLALAPAASILAAIVPYQIRSVGFAMVPIYAVLIGGLGGAVLTGLLSDAYGRRTAMVCVIIPATAIGGLIVADAARFVRRDISLVRDELREERAERERRVQPDAGVVPAIQVRNLAVSYGASPVLFDVDLDVRRGEIVAVVGTNGAGKSTLLRTIAGLERPRRGVVRLNGRNVTYASAEHRVRAGLVLVPGGEALFPTLTVAENLLCGAYTLLRDPAQAQSRIDEMSVQFPVLRELSDLPAGRLSGGQQRLLAIAKALVLEPDVVLIDELTLGLDTDAEAQMLGVVTSLRDRGATVLIVDQSVSVAAAVADRAVFLERGGVRFDGPPSELAERDDLLRPVYIRSPHRELPDW